MGNGEVELNPLGVYAKQQEYTTLLIEALKRLNPSVTGEGYRFSCWIFSEGLRFHVYMGSTGYVSVFNSRDSMNTAIFQESHKGVDPAVMARKILWRVSRAVAEG